MLFSGNNATDNANQTYIFQKNKNKNTNEYEGRIKF